MYKKRFYFLLLLAVVFIFSCEEEKGLFEPPPSFAIREIHTPAVMSNLSSAEVLISVLVTHPGGSSAIRLVELQWIDSSAAVIRTDTLADDGGALTGNASGDAIAFDQVFSRLIQPGWFAAFSGTFTLRFRAVSTAGTSISNDTTRMDIFANLPPEILNLVFPDSIVQGMPPTEVQVTVQDNAGVEDIRWVLIQGMPAGALTISFRDTIRPPGNNSPVFRMIIDSSYAAGKKDGYDLAFLAEDRFGEFSSAVTRTVQIQNTPPLIWNASVPDSLTIPASGDVSVPITVQVKDGQSLADIDSVYFNSYLPGGNPSSGNPFLMYDNGLPYDPNNPAAAGDLMAGDGKYTVTIFLPAGIPPGTYRFEFFARDRAGQLTTGPVETIEAVQ